MERMVLKLNGRVNCTKVWFLLGFCRRWSSIENSYQFSSIKSGAGSEKRRQMPDGMRVLVIDIPNRILYMLLPIPKLQSVSALHRSSFGLEHRVEP
jgi:hypothetical protein